MLVLQNSVNSRIHQGEGKQLKQNWSRAQVYVESCWETWDDTSLVKLTRIRCHSKFSFYDATISFLVETEQSNSYVPKKKKKNHLHSWRWSTLWCTSPFSWDLDLKRKGFARSLNSLNFKRLLGSVGLHNDLFWLIIFFFFFFAWVQLESWTLSFHLVNWATASGPRGWEGPNGA